MWRFFLVVGSGCLSGGRRGSKCCLSGGRRGSKSDWKVRGGVVPILLMEELLSMEADDERSASKLSWDDPMLVVEGEELSVSSVAQGVVIECVLRFIRCVCSK